MFKYEVKNLTAKDLDEAMQDTQFFINFVKFNLLRKQRDILVNMNGKIEQVSCPQLIGIVGDILLPESTKVSRFSDVFITQLEYISDLATNYLAKSIFEAFGNEFYYENLRTIFTDPDEISEYSISETDSDVVYKDIIGSCLIENHMFGICFVEQLFLQVMFSVIIDSTGRIIEIVSMHSSILGT